MDKKTLDRLRHLDEKAEAGELDALEDIDRDRMIREKRLRRRVAEVIDNRQEEKMKVLQLEAEIERLKTEIRASDQNRANKDNEVQ